VVKKMGMVAQGQTWYEHSSCGEGTAECWGWCMELQKVKKKN